MENNKNLITNLKYKLNNGEFIPAIAIGTYKITEENDINTAIKSAYETGYRHIDSAILYENEALIGKAISKFNIPRSELFITTKIAPRTLTYKEAKEQIDQSLVNFNTKYIDLYLIHWPEVEKIEQRIDVWKALEEGVQEGKIKSIGVSNFLPLHLKPLLEKCKIKPVVNQFELHPLFIDSETIEMCNRENILIESYCTFGRMSKELIENEALVGISKKYNKKPTQVLLRWALQHGWVVLPKSCNAERIKENFNIDDFCLLKEDIELLDKQHCDFKIARSDPRKVLI